MKECEFCFEKKCICIFVTCAECKAKIPECNAYQYRGRISCGSHDFDEQVEKRDYERKQVMEVTEESVKSQRNGEFRNNRSKYNIKNVASDGLPICEIKEPQILKDYEGR